MQRIVPLLLLFSLEALAVPATIHQEGVLMDAQGIPYDGLVQLRFSLYDQAEGGETLWFEDHNLDLNMGYYSATLGAQTAFGERLEAEPRFIGVSVNGAAMSPRARLASAPYARRAEDVDGDINPQSISVGGQLVIDEGGNWVGPPIEGTNDGVGYDTPEEALAAIKTVDGAASSLDADLLDGLSSVAFVQGADQVLVLVLERDGGGNGLDVDLLDGHDSGAFVRTAAQLLELLLTTDGVGSGLDADRLDSYDSAEFMSAVDPAAAALRLLGSLLNVDGAGSGLDADRLGGLDSSVFMRAGDPATAAQILNLISTVDGAGSGLDVDLLDGLQADTFMRVDQDTETSGDLSVGGSFSSDGGQITGSLIADRIEANLIQARKLQLTPLDASPENPLKGTVYFDGQAHGLYLFDGVKWKPAGGVLSLGNGQETPGLSCMNILNSGGSSGDDVYWIDPNGGDPADAFQVYCDMSTDGGGWTLIGKGREGWNWDNNGQGSAEDLALFPHTNSVSYLPAHVIDSIIGQNVNELSDGVRIVRHGVNQDWRFEYPTMTSWDWGMDTSKTANLLSRSPDCAGVVNGNTRDTYWCGGGNDCHRIFTWPWSGHNNVRGWSSGSSCSCNGYGADGWCFAVEGHVILRTQVWVRESSREKGVSCKDILSKDGSSKDGVYWIDPNGGDPSDSLQVYCDMTTDGGGWTLCFSYDNSTYDSENWPNIAASRNKMLSKTWGETQLFGDGSKQGNFCNLYNILEDVDLKAEVVKVANSAQLFVGDFRIQRPEFFSVIHNAAIGEQDCLTDSTGSKRLIYANYASPSNNYNGFAEDGCSAGAAYSHARGTMNNPSGNYGTDGMLIFLNSASGRDANNGLALHVNWYADRHSETLYTSSGNSTHTKFGFLGTWVVNAYGRSGQSPGLSHCYTHCGYTNKVDAEFKQRIWLR